MVSVWLILLQLNSSVWDSQLKKLRNQRSKAHFFLSRWRPQMSAVSPGTILPFAPIQIPPPLPSVLLCLLCSSFWGSWLPQYFTADTSDQEMLESLDEWRAQIRGVRCRQGLNTLDILEIISQLHTAPSMRTTRVGAHRGLGPHSPARTEEEHTGTQNISHYDERLFNVIYRTRIKTNKIK